MTLLTMLVMVLGFPWLCLGFVLWMGRFEDGLPSAVRRAQHTADPAPVLSVPIRTAADAARPAAAAVPELPVPIPLQRSAADVSASSASPAPMEPA
jgi:hypothetical protein